MLSERLWKDSCGKGSYFLFNKGERMVEGIQLSHSIFQAHAGVLRFISVDVMQL